MVDGKPTRSAIEEGVRKGDSFEGADLKGIDLHDADLSRGRFARANFRYCDLRGAKLSQADLSGANLRHGVLTGADLSGTDLRGADLTHADLRGANLSRALLDGARVQGARGISEKVFFTQDMLDSLNDQNKIELSGSVLTILTGVRRSFLLVPACRFLKVEAGGDTARVVGKVKTLEEAEGLGFEIFRDSATQGETVYRVEPGFVGVPERKEGAEAAPPPPAPPSPPPVPSPADSHPSLQEAEEPKTDEDLLAEFWLKNMGER